MAPSVENAEERKFRNSIPCTMPQSLADAKAAKTRNPLKFAWVSQTRQQISAVTGLKFIVLCEHLEKILLLNKFFPNVDTCLVAKIA